ncbi:hypothetical protein ACD591_01220 [Rufibacter glacialis]|uniref:RtcB family protein n=1 Tax=Rufibacter glacialis TaxID=1259555 RepID=A0A5M8QHL0_9BACT|nr:RtcB family protein [Rufibacter glacialis]KAA6435519.1 RtcB family protein [Rufibacter glacialis]GGK64186.1 hypothetical protein GCM10011405_10230 [Rufibacter glacialis]
MVLANCRAQFTASDFEFVAKVLSKKGSQVSLVELLSDPECRDEMLDDEALAKALYSRQGQVAVSQQLYFYVLTRMALRRQGIEDRELADYVGALLWQFSTVQRMHSPHEKLPHQFHYIVEMLEALATASAAEAFLIRVHMGNYALFLSGMFRAWIERRQQRGAPDFSFYEEIGRTSFKTAAHHKLASQLELAQIYHQLADGFRYARLALNELSSQVWNPDAEPPIS